jgi:hypothetical protein
VSRVVSTELPILRQEMVHLLDDMRVQKGTFRGTAMLFIVTIPRALNYLFDLAG